MKLRADSWLVKWAYFPEVISGDTPDATTSLCPFIWRVLLLSPVIATFWLIWKLIIKPFIWWPLFYVIVLPTGYLANAVNAGPTIVTAAERTGDWLAYLHGKVCPIISIVEEPNAK